MNGPIPSGPSESNDPRSAKQKTDERMTIAKAGRYIGMATQLPFMIFAGYAVGYGLDTWLGTAWLRIACLLAAIIGAFAQLIRQVLRDQKKS